MGFLTSLFGGENMNIWSIGLALIIVLLLIVAAVWILKVIFNASGNVVRGRNKRLAIIDTISVDAKRNLILVRRDNVEHLILVGGGQDAVVETGIEAEIASNPVEREPAKRATEETPEERQQNAASRLGLTGILRRQAKLAAGAAVGAVSGATAAKSSPPAKSSPSADSSSSAAKSDSPSLSPLDRLKALGMRPDETTPPTLRHTGLLQPKPSSGADSAESVNGAAETHLEASPSSDSANMADQLDDGFAMSRIENGSAHAHGDAAPDIEDTQHADSEEPRRTDA